MTSRQQLASSKGVRDTRIATGFSSHNLITEYIIAYGLRQRPRPLAAPGLQHRNRGRACCQAGFTKDGLNPLTLMADGLGLRVDGLGLIK